jgi:hypothetical protein
MKLKKINLPSLVKSYNFIYYACIFMYVIIVTMLLGFGLYFHSNSTIPILDASTQEDLTVVTIVTKEFSPVLVQEELTSLTKDTFTLPDRGWLDWCWDNKFTIVSISIVVAGLCYYLVFGIGPPTLRDNVRNIVPITIETASRYLWPSITALTLYTSHGYDIAVALNNCAWEEGVWVSETAINHTLSQLIRIYGLACPLEADLNHVIYAILKNSYPKEDMQHLLRIAELLTKAVVHRHTPHTSSELPLFYILYAELVNYIQNK